MRKIATMAAAALCAGALETAHATDRLSLAERSGFLLGAAQHCGVDSTRIVDVGRRMMTVLAGQGDEADDAATASKRFAQFFVAASTAEDGPIPVRCDAVSAEFAKLERHTRTIAPAPSPTG